jgi:hypothetical protein
MARVFIVTSKRGKGCVIEWVCDTQEKAEAYIKEVEDVRYPKPQWIQYNEWEVQ